MNYEEENILVHLTRAKDLENEAAIMRKKIYKARDEIDADELHIREILKEVEAEKEAARKLYRKNNE